MLLPSSLPSPSAPWYIPPLRLSEQVSALGAILGDVCKSVSPLTFGGPGIQTVAMQCEAWTRNGFLASCSNGVQEESLNDHLRLQRLPFLPIASKNFALF